MQLTYLIQQPWSVPALVGMVAFLFGLLIPRGKGNTNILASLLFWPVSLLRDLLDAAHTKRLQYYALLLALLGMEAFFSVRAATVYYDILSTRMSAIEVDLVSVIVGGAIFLCGYMVASHGVRHADGTMDWGNFWIAALVVVHDITGVVYLNYGPGSSGSTDWASIAITVGMCAFSLVPFAMGNRAEKLRPDLEAELDQEVEQFTASATRTIKRRAVDRVLRLAGRTDVIHLVRSLPAQEFADFKAFVMPIIAPGIPLNLTNQEPSNRVAETTQNDVQVEVKMNEQKPSNATQVDSQKSEKVIEQPMSKNPSNDSSANTQKSVNKTTRKLSNDGRNDTSKKPSKNELRDARIRHFASTHDMTHAQLSKRFRVSVSTVARALNEGKPSTNGHSKERNTDEMEALVVTEGELVAAMN